MQIQFSEIYELANLVLSVILLAVSEVVAEGHEECKDARENSNQENVEVPFAVGLELRGGVGTQEVVEVGEDELIINKDTNSTSSQNASQSLAEVLDAEFLMGDDSHQHKASTLNKAHNTNSQVQ